MRVDVEQHRMPERERCVDREHAQESRASSVSHENCEATAISAKCTERWFGPTIDALWLAGYSRTVMVAVEDGVVTGITVDWSGTYPERAGDPDEEVLEWVGGFDADAEKVMADVVFEVPPSAEAAELWVEYTTR